MDHDHDDMDDDGEGYMTGRRDMEVREQDR